MQESNPLGSATREAHHAVECDSVPKRREASAAFGRLVAMHRTLLLTHICRRLDRHRANDIDAEDVLQETWIRVYREQERTLARGTDAIVPLLKAIADARAVDAIRYSRRKKRGGDQPSLVYEKDGDGLGNPLSLAPDAGKSPSEQCSADEAAAAIRRNVAKLPDNQRIALQKQYFDGMSVGDTAATLDCTTGAVRGLLHRARRDLRNMMHGSSLWFSS